MGIISYSTYSDGELLLFLKNGNQSAFAELYHRYHKPVYRYLISLVKVPEIAEDLVHEIFLKVWDIRQKLEIRENFKGYLFWMCHNKACDTTKKIAGERVFRNQLLLHYQGLYSYEERTLKELERYDTLVEEALNSLSGKRRKVFELCKMEGKSYKQVATELNISTHTVKEYMSEALSALREFLQERGELTLVLILTTYML